MYRAIPQGDAYDHFESRIAKIEDMLINDGPTDRIDYSFDIAFLLFPLLEGVAFTIHDKTARAYLRHLGYTRDEASLAVKVFRNGLLDGSGARTLKYDDGEIDWVIFSGSGSGRPRPHNPGIQGRSLYK